MPSKKWGKVGKLNARQKKTLTRFGEGNNENIEDNLGSNVYMAEDDDDARSSNPKSTRGNNKQGESYSLVGVQEEEAKRDSHLPCMRQCKANHGDNKSMVESEASCVSGDKRLIYLGSN